VSETRMGTMVFSLQPKLFEGKPSKRPESRRRPVEEPEYTAMAGEQAASLLSDRRVQRPRHVEWPGNGLRPGPVPSRSPIGLIGGSSVACGMSRASFCGRRGVCSRGHGPRTQMSKAGPC